jgi:hypothetical protein
MPFPLAHPAAVLPLRRFCPRWLNFPALVVGSLTPDAGYFFGQQHGAWASHEFLGGFAFCLPVGLVLVALFYWLRAPVVKLLPGPFQQTLLPLCQRRRGTVWGIVLSLLIGAWTHQLWDSFTHNDGWAVQNLPFLQTVVCTAAGHTARLCHVLWYGCSLAGVIWVFLVFEKWKRTCVAGNAQGSIQEVLRDALLVALLVLPVALAHHLIQNNHWGICLVAAACAVPLVGIVLRLGSARRSRLSSSPQQPFDRAGRT